MRKISEPHLQDIKNLNVMKDAMEKNAKSLNHVDTKPREDSVRTPAISQDLHPSRKKLMLKNKARLPDQEMSDRFQEIKTKLITQFPQDAIKTILFTGAGHGIGCTTTAIHFARTLTRDCRNNVLLIDANLRAPKLHQLFETDLKKTPLDPLSRGNGENKLYRKIKYGNFYIVPCTKTSFGPFADFESSRFDKTLEQMREKFDYVIIDAPHVTGYPETKVMGKKVDGVILIVESGKTRRQVAVKAKKELENAGANILGVILNRRKYYIPHWIYKRL